MFVGYEIKSNFGQAKPVVLETDIKLSQAVLDPAGKGNKKEPVCLMAEHNKKQFILAVLDPNQSWQCPLDLMFAAGSEIKFFLRGHGSVHLTGYEYREDMDDFDMSMSSDDEDVSEDEQVVVPKAKAKAKPVVAKPILAKTNGVKLNGKGGPSKAHGIKAAQQESEDDDDDEDDDDFDEDEDDSDAEGSDEEMDDSDALGELDIDDNNDSDVSDEVEDEDEESD